MTKRERRRSRHSRPIRALGDEAPRDTEETGFTPLLRELWATEPAVLAAVFVDQEGECVDYCSSLDPFDAKVAGAHLQIIMAEVREFADRVGAGRPSTFELHGSERDILVKEVGEGFSLVVVVHGRQTDQSLLAGVDDTVDDLRRESGIDPPEWDPASELEVSIRKATGWPYAPRAFVERGRHHEIAAVLGRWEESGGLAGDHLVCFRVRTSTGGELTLAYDEEERRWMRW